MSYPQKLIGDFCREGVVALQTGPFGSQLHSYDYVADGVPVIPTEAIKGRRIVHDGLPRVGQETADGLSRHKLALGDILFARRGAQATGQTAFVRDDDVGAICGTGAIRLRVESNQRHIFPAFLSHFLSSSEAITWLRAQAIGATMPNLNEGIIKRIVVPVPPFELQVQMAGMLDDLDAKIELSRRLNETLEAMAQSIFRDWFVDFGPTRRKIDGVTDPVEVMGGLVAEPERAREVAGLFPGSIGDDGLPEGWEERPFSALLDDVIGGDWGKEAPEGDEVHPVSIIRGTDFPQILSGRAEKVPSRYTTTKKVERRRLRDLDILLEVSGGSPTQPTGRSILLTNSILERFEGDVVCASFCRRLRPHNLQTAMIAWAHLTWLYGEGGTWEYQNQSTGISNFQTTHFLGAEQIVWPGPAISEKFASYVEPFVRSMSRNENLTLAATRDLLLPKLMSGEISLADARAPGEAAE